MELPFSRDDFFAVFGAYNEAVWPFQLPLLGAAVAVVLATRSDRRHAPRWILAILAGCWFWMGAVYHAVYFRTINPAAWLFAILFLLEAVLLAAAAARWTPERIRFTRDLPGIAGLALIGYALVLYPAIGYVLGHRYPFNPTFGLPCPTTLFTIGILLWARPLPRRLLVIPLVWSVIGFTAALQLGMLEDTALLVAAVVTILVLLRSRRESVSVADAGARRDRATDLPGIT